MKAFQEVRRGNEKHFNFHEKLIYLLENKKVHTNQDLSLNSLAESIGCSLLELKISTLKIAFRKLEDIIEEYRAEEVYSTLKMNPKISLRDLAEKCGFSSVPEMKTAYMRKFQSHL